MNHVLEGLMRNKEKNLPDSRKTVNKSGTMEDFFIHRNIGTPRIVAQL